MCSILPPPTEKLSIQFSSVQLLSRVQLFATLWTAAHQASLSISNSRSLLKLMSIELVMPSNHLILCCPLLLPPSIFPSIRVFPMRQLFVPRGQSIGASASVQFNSAAQACLTLCDPKVCGIPGFPVHQLLELAQTHDHQVGDAIQPFRPLSSPSPSAFNFPSIRVFSNESVLHIRWPKYWSFSISPSNEYSD